MSGEMCGEHVDSDKLAAAYRASFWRRPVSNAGELERLVKDFDENKDKLGNDQLQDILARKIAEQSGKIAQSNDPQFLQSLIGQQTNLLTQEAARCASKTEERSAAQDAHCKMTLSNQQKSLQQFSQSYVKEAQNIAKRGEENQVSIAQCQAMGPDAGACMQALAQKNAASAQASTQPGPNGLPLTAGTTPPTGSAVTQPQGTAPNPLSPTGIASSPTPHQCCVRPA
ncbi:MAG: hypothetical protein EOP84_32220 [Verrucomicrobiaceae bacterium]|nr:MAG: hypothetical protein EOP84_32220 [Verrucomicrobiaceae bacterium]